MGAKSGNGGLPRKFPREWTPVSAALMAFITATVICAGIFTVLHADRQVKQANQFKEYQAQVDTLNEQLGNYEKALKKRDITVVPILIKLRPQLDHAVAEEISKAIIKYSTEYRLPPEFVVHLMKRESGFNTLATSKAGAVGLMQVMPKAHKDKMKELGITSAQLFHIDNNVRLGCMILRDYYNLTGSIEKALKRYVGGSHATYTQDILIGYTNETIPLKPELSKSKLPVALVN